MEEPKVIKRLFPNYNRFVHRIHVIMKEVTLAFDRGLKPKLSKNFAGELKFGL